MDRTFSLSTHVTVSAAQAWEWHARPGALERLVPPWERVRVVQRDGGIANGDRTEIELAVGPARLRWIAEHRDSEPGRGFTDVMVSGPFAAWTHRHSFEEADGGCRLTDRIRYRLPCGALADALGGSAIDRRLQRTFEYRHRVTAADLALHRRYTLGGSRSLLVSGSTGLVGSALTALLSSGGHRVTRLARGEGSETDPLAAGSVRWDPARGRLATEDVEGFDAVVHLAGESIAGGPWTAERKARIRDSRVEGTMLLCEALARAERPPAVLVCASAVGYYGDRGDAVVDENAGPGSGFLADTCVEWEAACAPARHAGIRVVNLRIGVVLTPAGGALEKMLVPFRLGLGGVLGSGAQYWSWITLDDLLGTIVHAVATDDLEGPVNVVSPDPPTNREFTRALGAVLGRPTVVPVPAAALRLTMGEMADEMLLGGARVIPTKLRDSGYGYLHPELGGALRHVLGRSGEGS